MLFYDVTSTLVDLSGARMYKGITKGLRKTVNWIAKRGIYKSTATVETTSYKVAEGVKEVFQEYKKQCDLGNGIPWESIETEKRYNEVSNLTAEIVSKREQMVALWESTIESKASYNNNFQVTLKNDCNEKINVAIYYKDLNEDWVTQGWWTVDPYSEVLTTAKSWNSIMYFYAYSDGWDLVG